MSVCPFFCQAEGELPPLLLHANSGQKRFFGFNTFRHLEVKSTIVLFGECFFYFIPFYSNGSRWDLSDGREGGSGGQEREEHTQN